MIVIKHLTKQLKKGTVYLVHRWRVKYTMSGKAWLEEHEAADHIVSEVRSQREMNADVEITFCFFSVWFRAHGTVLPAFNIDCLTLSQYRN